MVEKANKKIATTKTNENQGNTLLKAAEVSSVPSKEEVPSANPVNTSTKAVIVQTTTVSTNGSNNATTPSLTGSDAFVAAWAIEADPIPASFENAALWKPTIITPIIPPLIAGAAKAPLNISTKTLPTFSKFMPMIIKAKTMYNPAIKGTTLSVTLAMLLIPLIITIPTSKANITPNQTPIS